jgi:uncharacterized membrane protein YagU involved in acid resistance
LSFWNNLFVFILTFSTVVDYHLVKDSYADIHFGSFLLITVIIQLLLAALSLSISFFPQPQWLRPCSTAVILSSNNSSKLSEISGVAMHISQRSFARNFGYKPRPASLQMPTTCQTHQRLTKHHGRCLLCQI